MARGSLCFHPEGPEAPAFYPKADAITQGLTIQFGFPATAPGHSDTPTEW